MNKRVKCFRIIPRFLNGFLRGEIIKVIGLPKDVELLRFNYEVTKDAVLIILTSKEWPEVDIDEMIDIEELRFQKID